MERNVHVKINSGSTVLTESDIYVPKAHLASKLGEEGGAVIGRTGNNLTWTPDNNNVSGKIILFYHLYSDDGKTELDVDAELLDDDGSFSLDNIISNTNIKKIGFTLISGNTVSTTCNGKKILFHIDTRDHHNYMIFN